MQSDESTYLARALSACSHACSSIESSRSGTPSLFGRIIAARPQPTHTVSAARAGIWQINPWQQHQESVRPSVRHYYSTRRHFPTPRCNALTILGCCWGACHGGAHRCLPAFPCHACRTDARTGSSIGGHHGDPSCLASSSSSGRLAACCSHRPATRQSLGCMVRRCRSN